MNLKFVQRIYIFFLTAVYIFSFFVRSSLLNILIIFLVLLPLYCLFSNKKVKDFLTFYGIFMMGGFILLALFYKLGRGLFPIPEINKNFIIGYTHYFGYPFY